MQNREPILKINESPMLRCSADVARFEIQMKLFLQVELKNDDFDFIRAKWIIKEIASIGPRSIRVLRRLNLQDALLLCNILNLIVLL